YVTTFSVTAGSKGSASKVDADVDLANVAIGPKRTAVHVPFDIETADAAGSKCAHWNAACACRGHVAAAARECCKKCRTVPGVTNQIAADRHLAKFALDCNCRTAHIR